MTLQDEYTGTVRRTADAWVSATEVWTDNVQKVTDTIRTPVVPAVQVDVTGAVEQWFDFSERVAKVNREYVVNLAGVGNALTGAVRQHADALAEAVRDQVQAVAHIAKEQVDKVAAAEREQITQVERA